MRSPRIRICILLLPILLLTTGCQTMSLASPSELFEKEPEFVTPSKVIPVWSDTVLHQAGKKGQRGCGGRVMFYARDGKRAVRVDGSLVVYAWDDSRDSKQRKPDRKYVFPTDDFQKHYSTSSIGDSYSFWIPWDETGGQQTELTLVARFVGRNGAEITSTPAKVILPGEVAELDPSEKTNLNERVVRDNEFHEQRTSGIQQVGFEQHASGSDQSGRRRKRSLTSSEIPLTDGFLKRNMSNGAATYSAEELFKEPGDTPPADDNSLPERAPHQTFRTGESPGETHSSAPSDGGQTAIISPAEDHSLQFRHRVQTSRATQRSVDRALSQRYQSGSRRAPWERD